jgi:3-ketosteroid 9alpha-monooxygenase subunit A
MQEFTINFGVMMKRDPKASKAQNAAMVQEYMDLNIQSFHQDVAVWNNKCIIDNPLLCDGDGPINLVRKWYSQFMTNVADIQETQVRAREHTTLEGPTVEDTLQKLGLD